MIWRSGATTSIFFTVKGHQKTTTNAVKKDEMMRTWTDHTTIHSVGLCLEGMANHKSGDYAQTFLQFMNNIIFSDRIFLSSFETEDILTRSKEVLSKIANNVEVSEHLLPIEQRKVTKPAVQKICESASHDIEGIFNAPNDRFPGYDGLAFGPAGDEVIEAGRKFHIFLEGEIDNDLLCQEVKDHALNRMNNLTPLYIMCCNDSLRTSFIDYRRANGWATHLTDTLDAYLRTQIYRLMAHSSTHDAESKSEQQNTIVNSLVSRVSPKWNNKADIISRSDDIVYWPNSYRGRAAFEAQNGILKNVEKWFSDQLTSGDAKKLRPASRDISLFMAVLIRRGKAEPLGMLKEAFFIRDHLSALRDKIKGHYVTDENPDVSEFFQQCLDCLTGKSSSSSHSSEIKFKANFVLSKLIQLPVEFSVPISYQPLKNFVSQTLKPGVPKAAIAMQNLLDISRSDSHKQYTLEKFVKNCEAKITQ